MTMLGAYELNQIITGDARELAQGIPDESVDLIFTDPVYDRIDDYRWLAETAARVLKPNSAVLVWCWVGDIASVIDAMRLGGLSYRWMISNYKPGRTTPVHGQAGYSKWTPVIWMDKGRSKNPMWMDAFQTMPFSEATRYDNRHTWSKDPESIYQPLQAFSKADWIVLDPFTGGGTVPAVCKMLGRNYLAFEIDPPTAERARERVRNTQPPLFVLQPEQVGMELDA